MSDKVTAQELSENRRAVVEALRSHELTVDRLRRELAQIDGSDVVYTTGGVLAGLRGEKDRRIAELERELFGLRVAAGALARQLNERECDREHEAVRIAQGLLDAMGKARHEFDALRGCGREER